MKRFATALALLLVCVSASAVQIETGTNGQRVSTVNPLAVQVVGGVAATGSTDVNVLAGENGTSSALLLTGTPQEIVPMTSQRYVALFASWTFEWGLGSFSSAISNRPSVYNVVIPANISISVWTTATPTYLGVDRVGE